MTTFLPQELLLTRLAVGIVEREDDDVTMEKLDKALGELFEKKVFGGWERSVAERVVRVTALCRSRCADVDYLLPNIKPQALFPSLAR